MKEVKILQVAENKVQLYIKVLAEFVPLQNESI